MREAIQQIIGTYRFNPPALESALIAFIESTLEKRAKEDERDLAVRICRHIHPAGPSGLYCADCHKVELDRATGADRPLVEGDV